MVELVRERLHLAAESLLVDAYAGVGTFAALLAPHCKRVLAIEEAPSAVEDAREGASDVHNLEFVMAKTEEALARPGFLPSPPDALIMDPPRKGCHPSALEALKKLAPRRVVYVSCDPATLARDLRFLLTAGYQLEQVTPFDMFPQTYHIESISTLRLKV